MGNHVLHKCSKHVDIKCQFVTLHFSRESYPAKYICRRDNTADTFTKPFSNASFTVLHDAFLLFFCMSEIVIMFCIQTVALRD